MSRPGITADRDAWRASLLPCPFCGGEATINERLRDGYRFAECESCAFGLCAEHTKAEAIAAWNTRTAAAEIEALREALQGLEWACERLAANRPQAAYEAYIGAGQADALLSLDVARQRARALLARGTTSNAEGVL